MAQLCEKRKFDFRAQYPSGYHENHRRIGSLIGVRLYEPVEECNIRPIRAKSCDYLRVSFEDLKEIVKIEKQLLEMSLEESSLELCSKLRASVGLPSKFEADETALANLDRFLADLADREIDSSELVRAARRRL